MVRRLFLVSVFVLSAIHTNAYAQGSIGLGTKVIQFSGKITRALRMMRESPQLADKALRNSGVWHDFPKHRQAVENIRWMARFGSTSKNGMPTIEKLAPGGLEFLELERTTEGQRVAERLYIAFDEAWDAYLQSQKSIQRLSQNIGSLERRLFRAEFDANLRRLTDQRGARLVAGDQDAFRISYASLRSSAQEMTPRGRELLRVKLEKSPGFQSRSTRQGRSQVDALLRSEDSSERLRILEELDLATLRALDEAVVPKRYNGSLDGFQVNAFLRPRELYEESYGADFVSDVRLLDPVRRAERSLLADGFAERVVVTKQDSPGVAVPRIKLLPTKKAVEAQYTSGERGVDLEALKNLLAAVDDHLQEPVVRDRHWRLMGEISSLRRGQIINDDPLALVSGRRISLKRERQIYEALIAESARLRNYLHRLKGLLDNDFDLN